MKLITYKPNTFLSLTCVNSIYAKKSEDFTTVISVNNINSLLVKIECIVLSIVQRSVGFLTIKNSIPQISKNIQRFILVGWIDRP
ncbi:MAG: hypothetical protein BM563_09215 [Bacteroidetes bacterium MedPE-SWsnd-G1]|nr:MAG: hypothetical protein BM563_09215 [Bacteroidetes bacterium MedPE-SWsnd-G1]